MRSRWRWVVLLVATAWMTITLGLALACLSGCAHGRLTDDVVRQLACNESCAAQAADTGKRSSSAWPMIGEPTCACRMDDDSIDITCRVRKMGVCP